MIRARWVWLTAAALLPACSTDLPSRQSQPGQLCAGQIAELGTLSYERLVRPCVDLASLETPARVQGPYAGTGQGWDRSKASMPLGTVQFPVGAKQGSSGEWYRTRLKVSVVIDSAIDSEASSYVRLFVGSGAVILFHFSVVGGRVQWESPTAWGTKREKLASGQTAVLEDTNYLSNFSVMPGPQDVRIEVENLSGSLVKSIILHREGTGVDVTRESPYPLRVESAELMKVDGRNEAVKVKLRNLSGSYDVDDIDLRVEAGTAELVHESIATMLPDERRSVLLELPADEQFDSANLSDARVVVESNRNRPWRPLGIPPKQNNTAVLVGRLGISILALASLGTCRSYARALAVQGVGKRKYTIAAYALTAVALVAGVATSLNLSRSVGAALLALLVSIQVGSIVAAWNALAEASLWSKIGLGATLGTIAIPLTTTFALILRALALMVAVSALARGGIIQRNEASAPVECAHR